LHGWHGEWNWDWRKKAVQFGPSGPTATSPNLYPIKKGSRRSPYSKKSAQLPFLYQRPEPCGADIGFLKLRFQIYFFLAILIITYGKILKFLSYYLKKF
jgi:hypothetical protein